MLVPNTDPLQTLMSQYMVGPSIELFWCQNMLKLLETHITTIKHTYIDLKNPISTNIPLCTVPALAFSK